MNLRFIIAILSLMLITGIAPRAQQAEGLGVREYIQVRSFDRASYSEVRSRFDASATPELIEMLDTQSEQQSWAKAAYTLGAVGDNRAVDALISFVERPKPPSLSDADAEALKVAIESLGFLVNRLGNQRALTYLIDGLTPQVWRTRGIEGRPERLASFAEYDLRLSKYALFGLALSGDPRAGEALESLQRSPTPQQAEFRDGLDTTLAQWLEVHGLVAERGIEGMYDYYETRYVERLQEGD